MQTLRPYQRLILQQQARLAERHRRILVVLPTGGGKTTIAAANIASAVANGFRVLFLAHRTELIEQCSQRLGSLAHGVIKAGYPEQLHQPVQVGSVQTALRRPYWGGPRMLVYVDEAHRAVGDSYTQVLARYPHAWVVGLTATPYRLDGAGLQAAFDCVLEATRPQDLFEAGYLAEPVVYSVKEPDLTGVRTRAGEYDSAELERRMATITGDLVPTWQRLARGVPTLCFAVSRAHSRAAVAEFAAAGIPAAHVDGESSAEERRGVLEALAVGRLLVVSNVDLLTEGFDGASYCPPGRTYRPLGALIAARPTASMGLWFQMLGRVTRPGARKVVLDHAGNTRRHGLLRDHHGFGLDGTVGGVPVKGRPPVALRRCPVCAALLPALSEVCPCGAALGKPREVRTRAGELAEVTSSAGKRPATAAEKISAYRALLKVAESKGYKRGWADHLYQVRFGEWPSPGMRAR